MLGIPINHKRARIRQALLLSLIYIYIDQTKVFEKTRFSRRHPGNILKRRDLKLFGPPRDTLKTKTANFQASSSSGKWFSK